MRDRARERESPNLAAHHLGARGFMGVQYIWSAVSAQHMRGGKSLPRWPISYHGRNSPTAANRPFVVGFTVIIRELRVEGDLLGVHGLES